ncbi:hypothetical protein C9374_013345 [Naegleria lovaniensis]|uniref:Calponin-homology (CH) domain-containing protein n=1 Tax=Naegleria lovaniensis TaxID=51637 RepID=A0AA88GZ29_NAELO|nr:uncharacterized protein C9374_013345 [Naegleria lovaniensis]KAG2391860.1 hypothetical protein C9374_013345 [Naegleria lovaniensis]
MSSQEIVRDRKPSMMRPLKQIISVPDCIKDECQQKREKIRAFNSNTLATPSKPSSNQIARPFSSTPSAPPSEPLRSTCSSSDPTRSPVSTGPMKSLHILFHSRSNSHGETQIHDNILNKSNKSQHQVSNMKSEQKEIRPKTEADEPSLNEMEKIAKNWLHCLNFDSLLSKEQHSLLDDPLRNGTFFCELVETLERTTLNEYCHQPKKMSDINRNLDSAFSKLKQKNIPAKYLCFSNKIIRGDKETIWGLLYHISKAYSEAINNKEQHFSKKEFVLYSSEKMLELEKSIILWLRSLGMLPIHKPIPDTFEDIDEEIRNGTILCDLVGFILGDPIIGVTRNPKIPTACRSNIFKAIELLRQRKKMCQKFLNEEEILNGNKNYILGLFEDIRRYYDGIAMRTEKTDTPYLGNLPSFSFPTSCMNTVTFPEHSTSPFLNQTKPTSKTSLLRQMMSSTFVDETSHALMTTGPTELQASIPTPITSKHFTIEQRSFPESFFPSSQLKSVFIPPPNEVDNTTRQMITENSTTRAQILDRDVPYKLESKISKNKHSDINNKRK